MAVWRVELFCRYSIGNDWHQESTCSNSCINNHYRSEIICRYMENHMDNMELQWFVTYYTPLYQQAHVVADLSGSDLLVCCIHCGIHGSNLSTMWNSSTPTFIVDSFSISMVLGRSCAAPCMGWLFIMSIKLKYKKSVKIIIRPVWQFKTLPVCKEAKQ